MTGGKSAASPCARSQCPIANALDIFGDKWTLLVIRDLLFQEKHLYGELAGSDERIPTNILADRLKRLTESGLISSEPYQNRPVRRRYSLTPKGKELIPVLKEIIKWSNKNITGTNCPPDGFLDLFEKAAKEK
ncbi:helix-turn-helix transcriptional regulator [Candidatus Saganbacteria bacterium]|uniref:Helix-turn-helix transcriptional regulator n=1 Tax=Candidatus Saganbacteria bacterium TaxID=2575572 RepID=A0A9D6UK03_UNCSA|nr:helix-turn-helix transcriptional regulator [Candidatus Saganbacteria bacterium]